MTEATQVNQRRWDALAARHGQGDDAYYDIVTAAASAGLRVESVTEWFDEERDPKLVTGADGPARFPCGNQYLPTSYGLRARRPAAS